MGLDVDAWTRLATITAFGQEFPDPQVAEEWPLVAVPGPDVAIRDSGFTLKTAVSGFTIEVGQGSMRKLLRGKAATAQYEAFARCLRLVAAGTKRDHIGLPTRLALLRGIEDAWRTPLVNQQWRRLMPVLREIGIDRVLFANPRLCQAMATEDLLRSGAASTRGYVQ